MQPRIHFLTRSLVAFGLLFGLGATLLLSTPRAHADDAAELIANGDFSEETTGWRTNGPPEDLAVISQGGNNIAELTVQTQGHAVLNDRVNTVLDTGRAGQTYEFTARVRTTTPNVDGALRVREVTPEDAISHESSFRLSDTAWHTVELEVTTSRANAWLDVNLTAWQLNTGENLQIDFVTAQHTGSASAPAPAPASAPRPAPEPAPDQCSVVPSGDTLFGASISSSGGLTAADSLAEVDRMFGSPQVIRHFSPGLPFEWDSSRAELLEDRTIVLSFKANPRDITSGRHDRFFREWFADAPNDQVIYWSYFHEPENNINRGEFTTSQYRAAWDHLADIADEFCKPNMHSTLILTEWTMNPSSGRDYRTYDAGHDVVDVLAFDPYNGASDPGRDYYRPASDLLGNIITAMESDGRPWGVAEVGSRLIPGDTGPGRAAWLTDVGELLIEHDALFATYFHSTSDGNWRLDDRHSNAVWRNFVG